MPSKSNIAKDLIKDMFLSADIQINGPRPWDITVHNENLYGRLISQKSLGLGESYMDGWWDVEELDEFFNKIIKADLDAKIGKNFKILLNYLRARVLNSQKRDAFHIGEHHYDIGNDVYQAMLDKQLTYTCGYWKNAKTLDEAQEAKLDLVCRKLDLKKGQRVLDIGSGWGSFIKFAARRYGVTCVGVTVSKEQASYANNTKGDLPIQTRLQDYREVDEKFDHVVSLGMFEHVGYKNYRTFMKKVSSLLKDDGLFLLHTIGNNVSVVRADAWMAKYIFPGAVLPSMAYISAAAEKLFVMEDWHNFGTDYDKTLMAWFDNFNKNWPSLEKKYGQRFYRMWKYYLLVNAGSFRSRKNQLWQMVFSKKGIPGGYTSVR